MEIPNICPYDEYFLAICPLGAQMAIERLGPLTPFLADFELQMNVYEGYCDDATQVKEAISIMESDSNNLPIIHAMGCAQWGQEFMAGAVNYYNFTAIAMLGNVNDGRDRQRYRNFFSLGESFDDIALSLLTFIKSRGWTHVAIIDEINPYYLKLSQVLLDKIKETDLDLLFYEHVPYWWDYTDEEYGRGIASLASADPRVIVYPGDSGYIFLCWMHRYKMYGPNYAIFIGNWGDTNKKQLELPEYAVDRVSSWCTVEIVREVLNTTFIFGEVNRADISKDEPDDVGMTWKSFDQEFRSRVDQMNSIFIYEGAKFVYYDFMLFTGVMLNEAERVLQLRNDSLINWSIKSENFKNNGRYIDDVLQEAMTNIRVTGLRGSYQFQKNTTMNTGGYTPMNLIQCITTPDSLEVEQVYVTAYDSSKTYQNRLMVFENKIQWNTVDGKHPFDRVQIKRIDLASLEANVMIVLMVISACVCVLSLSVTIWKRATRKLEFFLIILGIVICNSHVFLLPLRDVEPVALHCSILAALVMAGISIILVVISEMLKSRYRQVVKIVGEIKMAKAHPAIPTTMKLLTKNGKLHNMALIVLVLSCLILAVVFTWSVPVESINSEATLEDSFGKREIELPTRKKCQLSLSSFSIVIICFNVGLVVLSVLKSLFSIYKIRLLKKNLIALMKVRKITNNNKIPPINDHGNFFVSIITIVIAAFLVMILLSDSIFYVTSMQAIALGVVISINLVFY